MIIQEQTQLMQQNSNTTFVKVKFNSGGAKATKKEFKYNIC